MRPKVQGGWTGPGPLEIDVFQIIFDEFADARRAVDMGNDLEQEGWFRKRGVHGRKVGGAVLITHGGGCNADGAVVERTDQRVDLRAESGTRQLFWKAPQLASARNGRVVIEKHTMGVATLAAS